MALKTKIKVGNITNLSDARYCAGMGVDMLGFKIGHAAGEINPVTFKEITDWISGPEFILESATPSVDVAESTNIRLIELPVSAIKSLDAFKSEYHYIVQLDLKDWMGLREDLGNHAHHIKYLLIIDSSGAKDQVKKEMIAEMALNFNVLLGFDIQVQQLEEYLTWPIEGFALNGSEETSPGIKDYDHLSAILEKLEVD